MTNNINEHKFVVFCEDHYNPLGICRSLGEEKIEPIVVLIGENPTLIPRCKYVKTIHNVQSKEEGLRLIIDKYGNESSKPFIFTSADDTTELLDQHYDELVDSFYFFNGGGKGVITHYMNKEVICNVAQECGIDKPKGEVLYRGEVPFSLRYPIITKVIMSIKGAWKKDVYICKTENELINAWKTIKADEILAQEYIVKKNELCVDGISINGGKEIWIPNTSEYIRFTDQGYGNYMWIKPYTNNEVRKKIQNILKKTHFSGIFSLECLIDENDNLYFLEVNFRNSTWSYAYTFAGLNLPYQWAKSTLAGHIDYSSAKVRTAPFKAMAEFHDFDQSVRTGTVSLFNWIMQFHRTEVTFVYNSKDKKPFIYKLYASILRRINVFVVLIRYFSMRKIK